VLLGLILLPAVLLAFCVGPPSYYRSKLASPGRAAPAAFPIAPVPERQTEPHTCGLHTLNSLYRAYGLNPDARRLRFRLGTDKPFPNFIPDTTGTIHPDMLRVLRQDGFRTDLVNPFSDAAPASLAAHLDSGHFAIALVGGAHWVLLIGRDDDRVVVCDSLARVPYAEPLAAYIRDHLYTLVLVNPEVNSR
jgi:hypothetical protein